MVDEAGPRRPHAAGRGHAVHLGPALRRAWVGYQVRLDAAMAAAGFEERRLPEGRVLRLCARPDGSTIAAIGRELGMTRQGAAKVVAQLGDRGYVSVADSAVSGREKSVTIAQRGRDYLRVQQRASRRIETELRAELGEVGFNALVALLDALGAEGDQVRMRDYLAPP